MRNIFIIKENTLLSEIQKAVNEGRKVIKVGSAAPAIEEPLPPTEPIEQGPIEQEPIPSDGEENQFDKNFDAGVEADEDTDPKRYIQQLTGKLSQKLNSYNEGEPDTATCKYVASMIIAATCKNLDDKAKKELADKVINTSSEEETEPSAEEMPTDNGEEVPQNEEPIQEGYIITKKQLSEFASQENKKDKKSNNLPKAWIGKK